MAFYWAHTCTFKNRFSVEQRGHKESLDFGVLSNQKGVAKATTLSFSSIWMDIRRKDNRRFLKH